MSPLYVQLYTDEVRSSPFVRLRRQHLSPAIAEIKNFALVDILFFFHQQIPAALLRRRCPSRRPILPLLETRTTNVFLHLLITSIRISRRMTCRTLQILFIIITERRF